MNTHLTMQQPNVPQTVKLPLQKFFQRKGRRGRLLFIFVYLPTFIFWVYLTFISSPMYISESNFALRSSEKMELPTMAGLLFQASSSITYDSYIIQSHIRSMDMLEKVMEKIDLRAHYADRQRDIFSRLTSTPTKEEMLKYWQWLTSTTFDPDKGIITVEVKAYTPEMAKTINTVILECSEELVNQMNRRSHQDALTLTKNEITLAEERMRAAQKSLKQFRDDKAILDPSSTAQSLGEVITKLETEAAAVRAELEATLEVMRSNSPRAQVLKTKLHGLLVQIGKEKARLAGFHSNSTLSSLVGDYTQLATEEKFAQDQLVAAMKAYETARLNAIAQSLYIVPFQPPTLPQESLYPRPLLFTLFCFLILHVLLGIVSLVIAAILDHMEV